MTHRLPTPVDGLYLVRRIDAPSDAMLPSAAYVSDSDAKFIVVDGVLQWDNGKPDVIALYAALILAEGGAP